MITIDFTDTYKFASASEDLSLIEFYSPDKSAQHVLIRIHMTLLPNNYLKNVYNLAFGPLNEQGVLDDRSRIPHHNPSKMFSTVLFAAYLFLKLNHNTMIGIDGSTDSRTYLYHRMFVTNRNSLAAFFLYLGADWYVRLLRTGDIERQPDGSAFFKPKLEQFDYKRAMHDLYRYYLFQLNHKSTI